MFIGCAVVQTAALMRRMALVLTIARADCCGMMQLWSLSLLDQWVAIVFQRRNLNVEGCSC